MYRFLNGLCRPNIVAAVQLHGGNLMDHLMMVAAADIDSGTAQLL